MTELSEPQESGKTNYSSYKELEQKLENQLAKINGFSSKVSFSCCTKHAHLHRVHEHTLLSSLFHVHS